MYVCVCLCTCSLLIGVYIHACACIPTTCVKVRGQLAGDQFFHYLGMIHCTNTWFKYIYAIILLLFMSAVNHH